MTCPWASISLEVRENRGWYQGIALERVEAVLTPPFFCWLSSVNIIL